MPLPAPASGHPLAGLPACESAAVPSEPSRPRFVVLSVFRRAARPAGRLVRCAREASRQNACRRAVYYGNYGERASSVRGPQTPSQWPQAADADRTAASPPILGCRSKLDVFLARPQPFGLQLQAPSDFRPHHQRAADDGRLP